MRAGNAFSAAPRLPSTCRWSPNASCVGLRNAAAGTALPGAIITRCWPATRVPGSPKSASPTSVTAAGGVAGSLPAAAAVVDAATMETFSQQQIWLKKIQTCSALLPRCS